MPIEVLLISKILFAFKFVSINALVPFGVTPVLAKVQPLLNVPVKLELFKFCAHAAALAPTIGYTARIAVHMPADFMSRTSWLVAVFSVSLRVPPAEVTRLKKAWASGSKLGPWAFMKLKGNSILVV